MERKTKGQRVFTPFLQGGVVKLEENTWMLEHCRGYIPLLLPFGLADSVLSSLDPFTIGRQLWHYGKMALYQLVVNQKI